jgi:alpha-glucosidase
VGEVNIRSTASVAEYYGAGDELHMSFNFPPLDAPWDPVVFRTCIREVEQLLSAPHAWPTWVLSNHDNERHRTRYDGSMRRARAAAVLLLGLRGTTFVYQGEELGLENAVITPDTQVDPGGRDGCRAPVPWTPEPPHGWGTPTWLPFAPDAGALCAQTQWQAPGSMLHLYRRLIEARRASPALRIGTWEELPSPPPVLAWQRGAGADQRIVCINFADHVLPLSCSGAWRVQIASDGAGEGEVFSGEVAAEQGLVLEPASP